MFTVGIITSSDKGYVGEREDKSGLVIEEIVSEKGFKVIKINDAIMLEEYDFYPDKNIYLKNEYEGAVLIKNGKELKMIKGIVYKK